MSIDTTVQQKSPTDQRGLETRAPALVIQPSRGWSSLALHELWQYRELLWFLTWRNIKGRYRQMALGRFGL